MRLLSWNVNGRVRSACGRQQAAVLERAPDVVALQEVTLASESDWRNALKAAGYAVESSIDLVREPYPDPRISRKYFNLIAVRGRVEPLAGLAFSDPDQARLAFPEKYLAVRAFLDEGELDVHNAHLPPGSTRGVVKVHAFEAIRGRIDAPTSAGRVLCGDFNTPQAEDAQGVTTSAFKHPGVFEEWDAAERGVLEHPEMRDVYRERHAAGQPYPASHFTRGTPRRYDHIYASSEFGVVSCRYLTDWLDTRLSDHAAVEAELVVSSQHSQRPGPDEERQAVGQNPA